jgi:hypothetical protein
MDRKPNSISSDEIVDNTNQLKNAKSIGIFGNISGNGSTQVHDFYLQNTTVKTATSATCAGIVAGYVDGKIENVGVISSGLDLGNTAHSATYGSNVSDYTVVGYANENYTTIMANSKTVVYNATTFFSHFNYRGMGQQTAWGGSMNIQKLYNRIKTSTNSGTTGPSYTTAEVRRYTNDDTYTVPNTQTGTGSNYKLKEWGGINGSYLKDYVSNTNEAFQSLGALYMDVYSIRIDGLEKTGYKIHDGNNHYLSYDVDNDEYKTVDSAENATIWLFENIKLYTFEEKEFSTTIIRYLNGTTTLVSVLTSTSSTTWSWDSTFNTFKYIYNNYVYSLNCVDGVFKMCKSYKITDYNGNYMRINNGNIENTRDVDLATKWVFSIDGENPRGYIYEINDLAKRISYSGSSLVVNESGSYFSHDGTNLSTGNGIIKFDGNNWVWAVSETFLIHQNGYYLNYNNGLSDTTNRGQAIVFYLSGTLSNTNGTGKIYLSDANNTRYLRSNNGLTTTIKQNDSGTDWAHDTYGYYYNDNGTRRYIKHDGSWRVDSSGEYYISYNGN